MQKVKIWHVSDGREFPLDITNSETIQTIETQNIAFKELGNIQETAGIINILLIQMETGVCEELSDLIRSSENIRNFPKLILIGEKDFGQTLERCRDIERVYVFDDSMKSYNLRLLMDTVVQLEQYRGVSEHLSLELRQHTEVFDVMVNMARQELKDMIGQSGAFQSLLQYEESHKKFAKRIQEAMDQVSKLRDRELLTLKSQLEASERLREYRDKELGEAKESFNAAQAALEQSRKERIQKEEHVRALERLQNYTEQELLDLIEENKTLREKLGLPPER